MVSLPESVLNTYKRYKNGTDKIISWLCRNGENTSAKAAKSKSKRKPTNRKDIRTYDLIHLASNIVASKVDTPKDIVKSLKEVIYARSSCAKWYRKNSFIGASSRDIEKLESHEYFINILEQVLGILGGSEDPQSDSSPVGPKNEAERSKPQNMYEHLEVHEPQQGATANETIGPKENVRPVKPVKDLQEPSDESVIEEQLFALFCFFKDAEQIRAFIGEVWKEYADGKCGLSSAAVTTNAAFDLLRKANEDLIAEFPIFNDHENVILFFEKNGYVMERRSGSATNSKKPKSRDVELAECFAADRAELASLICQQTWRMTLDSFTDISNMSFLCMNDYSLIPDAFARKSLLIDGELRNCYGTVCFVPAREIGYQILEGFKDATDETGFPSWLVIAFHTISVLRWTLWQGGIEQPYQELQEYADEATKTISEIINFIKTLGTLGFPALAAIEETSRNDILRLVRTIMKWAKKDIVDEAENRMEAILRAQGGVAREGFQKQIESFPEWFPKDAFQEEADRRFDDGLSILAGESREKHFLLRYDPVLCGLIMMKIKSELHLHSLRLANQDFTVFTCAHLYNTGLQAKLIQEKWQDMEDLISIFTPENSIFVGSRPTNAKECASRFHASIGFSVTARAKGASYCDSLFDGKWKAKPKNARRLHPTSIYFRLASVFPKDERKTFPHILKYDTQMLPKIAEYEIKQYKTTKKLPVPLENVAKIDEEVVAEWEKHKKLTQVQFLKVMHQSLEADEFHFHFDYISIIMNCSKFLKSFHHSVINDPRCGLQYGTGPAPDSRFLSPVGITSLAVEQHGKAVQQSIVLRIACELMIPIIKEFGDVSRKKNFSLRWNAKRKAQFVKLPTLDDLANPETYDQRWKVLEGLPREATMQLLELNPHQVMRKNVSEAIFKKLDRVEKADIGRLLQIFGIDDSPDEYLGDIRNLEQAIWEQEMEIAFNDFLFGEA
ncbi:hypothetical protein ABW19_dt0210223 [Dactylella cylindrospora]|nr:hypothetical protein ABW19_dt0210223 [Dactylella cylindrospora]